MAFDTVTSQPSPLTAAQAKQVEAARLRRGLDRLATVGLPVLTIAVVLLIWEGVTRLLPGGLPSPAQVWRDSHELITNPFFDRGGTDKGLFWHVATSLSRVGIGFSPR